MWTAPAHGAFLLHDFGADLDLRPAYRYPPPPRASLTWPKPRQYALPMPWPPPVTITTLSLSPSIMRFEILRYYPKAGLISALVGNISGISPPTARMHFSISFSGNVWLTIS